MSAVAAVDQSVMPPAEEVLRAELYELLATLLGEAPGAAVLQAVAQLEGDGSELGRAITTLAKRAGRTSPLQAQREYEALFVGLGRGELLPYGSYYLTGFLHEKPLAVLRRHMATLTVTRRHGVHEPEDHIATLCEVMAGLIRGSYGAAVPLAEQEAFFDSHLSPWAGHFFADLEAAKTAMFYAPVGTIGRLFFEIEIEAFRMDASGERATR